VVKPVKIRVTVCFIGSISKNIPKLKRYVMKTPYIPRHLMRNYPRKNLDVS